MPTPADVGAQAAGSTSPTRSTTAGPNDKGIGIQLAYSLARVLLGYLLAALVAIPLGFLIGMSPLVYRALDPFIQVLKPISPLAWMPLALFTIKDSGVSAIFVIFICSIWPMLINTAFGVASVRREWLNVARTLEVGPLRKAFRVILPAAAPTIMTGMRISIGIAWLVIVAAEMLVGGTGIGYFVWNEWNNLSITNIIFGDPGDRPGRHGCSTSLLGAAARGWSRYPSDDEPRSVHQHRRHRQALRRRGGVDATVFEDVHFAIEQGEFVCLIGHSGCGKTTILNILAGLDDSDADGYVFVDGREVARPEPRPRRGLPGPRADAVADGAWATSPSR